MTVVCATPLWTAVISWNRAPAALCLHHTTSAHHSCMCGIKVQHAPLAHTCMPSWPTSSKRPTNGDTRYAPARAAISAWLAENTSVQLQRMPSLLSTLIAFKPSRVMGTFTMACRQLASTPKTFRTSHGSAHPASDARDHPSITWQSTQLLYRSSVAHDELGRAVRCVQTCQLLRCDKSMVYRQGIPRAPM